jgi:HSP20 family protein
MGRFMNQMWGTAAAGGGSDRSSWLPALDVWETEDALVLGLDLPGIPEEKVAIEVDDGVLTVSGERERTVEQERDRFYRFERRVGAFSRSVTLPPGVNEPDIEARFENGVLEIRIPKPEERKPTRIPIGGSKVIEA